ncbi:hypothetical protein B4U79_08972, partial [Dinothrombium tinctorium]
MTEFANAMQTMQLQFPMSAEIRNFHGLPSECIRDFVESLELMKTCTGLNDQNLARRVPRYLRDIAQNWYTITIQKQPEIGSDWNRLKEELLKAFSLNEFEYKMNIESKLRSRVQGENEPFRSYYYDMLKLCTRLNPDMTDDERKSRILNGLRTDLYQQIASNIPQTCDELLQKLQSIESINNIVAERKRNCFEGYRNYNFPTNNEINAFFGKAETASESKNSFVEPLKAFALFYANLMHENDSEKKKQSIELNEPCCSKKVRSRSPLRFKHEKSKRPFKRRNFLRRRCMPHEKPKNKIDDFCVYCRKVGHRISFCREYRKFTQTSNIPRNAIMAATEEVGETEIIKNDKNDLNSKKQLLHSSALFIPVKVNCFPTFAVLDTGAGLSIISEKFVELLSIPRKKKFSFSIRSVNNELCESVGEVEFYVKIGHKKIFVNAHILPKFPYHLLIGNDIIKREKMIIDYSDDNRINIKFTDSNNVIEAFLSYPQKINLKTSNRVSILPQSFCFIKLEPIYDQSIELNQNDNYLFKISKNFKASLSSPNTLISIKKENSIVPIFNLSNEKIHIRKGKIIGTAKVLTNEFFADYNYNDVNDENEISPSDFDISDTLPNELKEKAISLLLKFQDCFVKRMKNITPTDIVEVEIETIGPPTKQKMYRLPYSQRDPLRKMLDELLSANIIRPSNSAYCAPILLVKKKNGDYRLVIDFRFLNSKIVNENCYPIPRIEEIIDQVAGSSVFSLLDCHSGFFTLKIKEKDKHKTAFICPFGLFEFNRLPQGLKISPNNFQMMMDKALSSVRFNCAKAYIDDCLVHSPSIDSHFIHLENTLTCIKDANVKLRPSKCEFFKEKIKFLGHVVSKDGIEICEDKVNAIMNLPEPKSVTEIKSFLGVLNYFKDHIKNLQILAEPLIYLTRKNVLFVFGERQKRAFDELKLSLCSAPILSFFNPEFETQLHTDGCTTGIGATLIQINQAQC